MGLHDQAADCILCSVNPKLNKYIFLFVSKFDAGGIMTLSDGNSMSGTVQYTNNLTNMSRHPKVGTRERDPGKAFYPF